MDLPEAQFTDSARQALARARDEADRLRHPYIGTEHLVLALTTEAEGGAVTLLRNLQVDLTGIRRMIEATVHPGTAPAAGGVSLPYTTRTQRILELARASAQALGDSQAGAEHLLVGALREATGIGGQVLLHHGLSEDAVIEQIRRIRSGGGASETG